MTPSIRLVLVVASFLCFVGAAWLSPQPDPLWKRIVSVGAALFVGSFISW